MCNACGNVCCGSDMFGGCGCDGCEEPECWSDDSDSDEDGDFYDCACRAVPGFLCVEVSPVALAQGRQP